ncbi:MAG: hypothetical protein ACI3VN_04665 [Candidatus Onthomonas sp.]
MGKRTQMPEHETNLLLTSGLILLICLILAAVSYFAFVLGIVDPPMTSHVPSRVGSSESGNSGIASPNGAVQSGDAENSGTILFPGFVDFSITDGVDTVTLSNDSQNTVSFRFTITDAEGQVLYSTEDIQPGESDQWPVTDVFDPGTGAHEITVRTDSYSLSDGSQLNGTSTTFTVDLG